MKFYYIDSERVRESIEYFKQIPISDDDFLFLFILAKHFGISNNSSVAFSNGLLKGSGKKEERDFALWKLAGLYSPEESAKLRAYKFPNALNTTSGQKEFFNGGTEASGVGGRIQDAIKQKMQPIPVFTHKEYNYTLSKNYQSIVTEHFLRDNGDHHKISLSYLAIWIHRFIGFEFNHVPSEIEFRKVLQASTAKFLKVSKKDLTWLFDDDYHQIRFTPSTLHISGEDFRGELEFSKNPEIEIIEGDEKSFAFANFDLKVDHESVSSLISYAAENPSPEDIKRVLNIKKQIILTGVPGIGKSYFTDAIKGDYFDYRVIQFHPNYSYEDFISSETLENDGNTTVVKNKAGEFLKFVDKASNDNSGNLYLLVIDEINRGNIAEIFGEMILALDRKYQVDLPKPAERINQLQLPPNLHIVGTMNTSDRNIAFLDLAIRRRFAFIDLKPDHDLVSESVSIIDNDDIDLGLVLKTLNNRILEHLKLESFLIGHSYFLPPNQTQTGGVWTSDEFKDQFNYTILPTLREYSHNDPNVLTALVGSQLSESLRDTDDFWEAFKNEFHTAG